MNKQHHHRFLFRQRDRLADVDELDNDDIDILEGMEMLEELRDEWNRLCKRVDEIVGDRDIVRLTPEFYRHMRRRAISRQILRLIVCLVIAAVFVIESLYSDNHIMRITYCALLALVILTCILSSIPLDDVERALRRRTNRLGRLATLIVERINLVHYNLFGPLYAFGHLTQRRMGAGIVGLTAAMVIAVVLLAPPDDHYAMTAYLHSDRQALIEQIDNIFQG